jgi:heme-degrading monooxygenase HmoA
MNPAPHGLYRQEDKGDSMIKGIVGCKVKQDVDLEPILLKLKSHAMQYQGFKGMENLVGEGNASVVAMVSTWESIEDWISWAQSSITQEVLRQAKTLLVEEPRVTTYRMFAPAIRWV